MQQGDGATAEREAGLGMWGLRPSQPQWRLGAALMWVGSWKGAPNCHQLAPRSGKTGLPFWLLSSIPTMLLQKGRPPKSQSPAGKVRPDAGQAWLMGVGHEEGGKPSPKTLPTKDRRGQSLLIHPPRCWAARRRKATATPPLHRHAHGECSPTVQGAMASRWEETGEGVIG